MKRTTKITSKLFNDDFIYIANTFGIVTLGGMDRFLSRARSTAKLLTHDSHIRVCVLRKDVKRMLEA